VGFPLNCITMSATQPSTQASAVDVRAGRLDELRASQGWKSYEVARDAVLEMLSLLSRSDAGETPSAYWREELAGFEYMLDASPFVIDKLRQHTYHITGLRTYDYRTGKDALKENLRRKRDLLVETHGGELLVPESRELGGFGYELDGELYNVDTLKFFESLIALDQAGVLDRLRKPERHIVWEIGGGWGGLAYHIKTVAPQLTYVISDLPEVMLFSATYLATMFPEATVRFWRGEETADELFRGWPEVDFLFVPAGIHPWLRPPQLDLTINTVSFQEMTDQQVREYVHHAADLDSDVLYSLNRDRSLYNTELSSVREIMSERFTLTPVVVASVSYNESLGSRRRRSIRPTAKAYRHVFGWRRPTP
jgi:putative sugar O-methyltransferase